MAMLEEAKKSAAKPVDKEADKDEADKKHKPKNHKAPPSAPGGPENDEASEGQDAGDAEQPGAETEGAEQQDGPGGAETPNPPQNPQPSGGDADQDDSDAGGDQAQGGQPAQQGGTQGASPVPSPAAPGAGDTTSGGEDTPDQDSDQGPETPGENSPAGAGSNTDLQQVPMSPGLKDEYDKANALLTQLLYQSGDDKLAGGILQGLMPQGPAKIKNAAMISIHVLTQIHKRLSLPPQLILPFAKDVVVHVLDLGQQVKQIQYSDQEVTAVLGSVVEGALRIFGVTNGQVKQAAHLLGRNVLQAQQQKYLQAHAHAKPAMDANNAAWHHDHLAGQQGAPTTAGPQTGAPVGAQTSPQEGGPPPENAGPPPAGGMLSQAAAAPQQGE